MTLIENTDITAEEIALEGLKTLNPKYQKTVGFFAWDFFVAIGKILYDIWQKIIYIARCLTDLSYMDYEDLKNFIYQTRGIESKSAAKSSGYLTITNGSGEIKIGRVQFIASKQKTSCKPILLNKELRTIFHVKYLTKIFNMSC